MTLGWWIRRLAEETVAVGLAGAPVSTVCLAIAHSAAETRECLWGACGPQVSTLAMYALLPVLVLMERKLPPEKIDESHSKFTCNALLKCRCLCPAAAKATHKRSGDAKSAGAHYHRGVAVAIL